MIRALTDPNRFRITWANGRRFYIDREPGCPLAEPMTEKQKVVNCTSIAKAVGSDAVHALIEALLRGEQPMLLEADAEPYEPIAAKVAADFAPLLTHMEVVGFSRLHGYGGTYDAMGLGADRSILLDWKTRGPDSQHGCYEKEVAQLGLGQLCDYYFDLDADGTLIRRVMPTFDLMLVVSIRPDSYEVYPVDPATAVEVAHDALAVHSTKSRAGSAARKAVGTPVPSVAHLADPNHPAPPGAVDGSTPPQEGQQGTATLAPPAAPTRAAAAAMVAPPAHRASGPQEATQAAWIVARYDALLAHADIPPGAVKAAWPPGLPGPKQADTMNTHQRQLAADALQRLEDEYEAPFTPTDPEAPAHKPRFKPVPRTVADADPLPKPAQDLRRADDDSAAALKRRYEHELTDDQRATVTRWLAEGAAAQRPWNMGNPVNVLLRRFEISRAAIALAERGWDDARCRTAIGLIIGEDWVQRHLVGALLGTLSVGEACDLADTITNTNN